jgi:hypothetical protein
MEWRLRQEMTQVEGRLQQAMTQMDTRLRQEIGHLREDMTRLDERVARLEHGQARLEGLLEGLREAITGRIASSCGPRAAKRGQSGCDSRPLVCAPMPQLIPIPQPILLERIYG